MFENNSSEQVKEHAATSSKTYLLWKNLIIQMQKKLLMRMLVILTHCWITHMLKTEVLLLQSRRPLSIFQNIDYEYLCFPCIFCGQRRRDNNDRKVPVHCGDIAKWELRSQTDKPLTVYLIYF